MRTIKQFITNLWLGAATLSMAPPPRKLISRPTFLDRGAAEAIAGDWRRVGLDLRAALDKFDASHERTHNPP